MERLSSGVLTTNGTVAAEAPSVNIPEGCWALQTSVCQMPLNAAGLLLKPSTSLQPSVLRHVLGDTVKEDTTQEEPQTQKSPWFILLPATEATEILFLKHKGMIFESRLLMPAR